MTILPQLKQDLFEAAEASLQRERVSSKGQAKISSTGRFGRSGPPMRRLGMLAAAVSVAVAIVVVGLAFTLLGRHGTVAAPAGRGSDLVRLERNPDIKRLVAHFAIFRRPQTSADRAWPAGQRSNSKAGRQVIPRLTRLAATIDGSRVFFTIDKEPSLAPPTSRSAQESYVMTVALVGEGGSVSEATYDANVGDYTIIPVPLGLPFGSLGGANILVSVVPDGIAKVRWVFHCPAARVAPCDGRREDAVTLPVHHNVAVDARASVARAPAVTWYDSDGRPVLSYNQHSPTARPPKPFQGIQG